ncbi:MAG: transcription repressor NadR [Lachnospiraceae bacterium]|nr:transcription repressor NadR [Candidatus Colinaster scatohippi]
MAVVDRHRIMVNMLKKSAVPLSGSHLSKELGVSRQIIVQDISELKASGHNIISTPKGYIYDNSGNVSRVFKVHHEVNDTEKELNLIVDLGGEVKDVFIFHKMYNKISAMLSIASRRDASQFCDDIRTGKSVPLMTATSGYHYHTVLAKDEATLDLIEDALWEHGFLAKLTDYEPEELNESIRSRNEQSD